MGSMLFYWSTRDQDMIDAITRYRIPPANIEWVERYYDRTLDFNDPKSYKKRPMKPLIEP